MGMVLQIRARIANRPFGLIPEADDSCRQSFVKSASGRGPSYARHGAMTAPAAVLPAGVMTSRRWQDGDKGVQVGLGASPTNKNGPHRWGPLEYWWWNKSTTETEILHINDLNRKGCRSVGHLLQFVGLCSTTRIAASSSRLRVCRRPFDGKRVLARACRTRFDLASLSSSA
jgi:hypothetical protein